MSEAMTLYGYWRSSAAYRLRIAFGLKGITWQDAPVHLVKGEQRSDAYRALAPVGLVPALKLADGTVLTQSLAILDWLEATTPQPPLWPADTVERAKVTAAGHVIAVDTHPVQNVSVVGHLKSDFGASQEQGIDWMKHWMTRGFTAFQQMCRPDTPFAFGEAPGFADLCLIPQIYNARRWGLDMTPFRRITEIETTCMRLPAFQAAAPENQPDAE